MNKEKTMFTGVFSIAFSFLGILAVPVLLMIGCNLIDYITGLVASKYREQKISSYKSIRGIYKKVCMWLLVVVGAMIDSLLSHAVNSVGIDMKLNFLVASIVAVWLICNEIISILENISDIGVSLPPFLVPLVKHIRSETEKKVDKDVAMDKGDKNEI